MRARRTRFAAPFVAVIAAGAAPACSHSGDRGGIDLHGKRAQRVWSINGSPGACTAGEWNNCPHEPGLHCNPPPPIAIDCPPGVATDGTAKIVSWDGARCVLDGPDTPIDCPAFKTSPPPSDAAVAIAAPEPDAAPAVAARQWQVMRKPDGTCEAFDDPCSRMQRKPGDPIPPCNPPPPQQIKCPPFVTTTSTVTIVQQPNGVCVVDAPPMKCPPNAKCNPPEPAVVDCPP